MDKIITHATDSIHQILELSSESLSDFTKSQLVDTRNLLGRLLETNSPRNDWTRLFCRRLERCMHFNDSLSDDFWIKLHDDILCVLEGPNGKQNKNNWRCFFNRMKLESQHTRCELELHQTRRKQKSLRELIFEHKGFFDEYLPKCISLHSKVQVKDLVENIDDLLYKIYGLTEVSLTAESRKNLSKKLESIEVTLDYSNRQFKSLSSQFSRYNNPYKQVKNSVDSFLPSLEQPGISPLVKPERIENVLQDNQWLVFLGHPCSGKTSLLRWFTCIFAEAAHHGDKEVVLNNDGRIPVRIPILIQIDEFVVWLDQNQTKTLIDYIGEHTWCSERYCHDDNGSALKELINYGHTLILLDGLDKISEVERRSEIVDLVKIFIDAYVRTPNLSAVFDDPIFNNIPLPNPKTAAIIGTQVPRKSDGNQIIVTSRDLSYRFYPLIDYSIKHYSLLLMSHKEAKGFVENWMAEVEQGVFDVFLCEGIQLDRKTVETLSKRRNNTINAMFEIDSELLMSNPPLLSLICKFIFQSCNEFLPKSPVEVYNCAVQAALQSWRSQKSSISESMLTNFLIDLATYLHLHSPSGLLDAFDMERLCCLSLKRQGLSNDRIELRKDANKLISFLDSNSAIVSEQGLQVFGFLHLSFQEYFVAQSLVRRDSIDANTIRENSVTEVTERILSFTINPQFRKSLNLALEWISCKWSFDDNNKFCNLLVTPNNYFAIPLGTLLFFDTIKNMQRLPSNTVIYTALNSLLNHQSDLIREKYMMLSLSQLPENIIIEWMQLYLNDDKKLFKFCQSLQQEREIYDDMKQFSRKSILPIVYQRLKSICHMNSSSEFVVDQTLRRAMVSIEAPDQTFNKDFSAYLLSHNINVSNIHPSILSAIIAVCGGISLETKEKIFKIHFSLKQMHHESSILASIVEYLDNNEEPHLTKVHKLIKQYEDILQKCLPTDTSVDIVDTFIALICLQSVSQPLLFEKYNGYQALSLALERFRRIWFYFKKSYSYVRSDNFSKYDTSLIKSETESIMNILFSQIDQSDDGRLSCSVACGSAWKKLGLWDLMKWSHIHSSPNKEDVRYFQCQPKFIHLVNEEKLAEIAKNIQSLQTLKKKSFFLLIFLPRSLQQLYKRTTIDSTNNTDSLPLAVFLLQCLICMEDDDGNNLKYYLVLSILQPLFKEHMLENYALALFREQYYNSSIVNKDRKALFKVMKRHNLLDLFLINQPIDWEILINVERQRICRLRVAVQSEEKSLHFFTASVSLARLFQARYRSHKYQTKNETGLFSVESEEVLCTIMNIRDLVLRIIALSIVLDMKDPLIFYEEQRTKSRWEMIYLLQSLLPCLRLLTSTVLFVRCHTARKVFPLTFHYMANIIGKKFNQTSIDKQSQDQEAAYIALRQLNNSDLSQYLSKFAKRTLNLSDLLRFNSAVFFRYFNNKTSFNSLNTILLSSMYLVELAFDVQILKIYIKDNQEKKILPLKELEQLWNDSSKDKKILTFKIAVWITDYLKMSNKKGLYQIIASLSRCSTVERNALSVIEKWLSYRLDKDLRFLAHYAALQLIIEGEAIPHSIDIINEIFLIDKGFRLKSIVERLFSSRHSNSVVVREILVALCRNVRYSSEISVWIDRKEILQLFLDLERERITSNVSESSKISTKPILLMIKGCSEDLQVCLLKDVRVFDNTFNEVNDTIKEDYVAVVVKWIIESSICCGKMDKFSIELYKYILNLLPDHRFPRVQKAIVNGLNSVFIDHWIYKEHVFIQNDTMKNLEKVICSWDICSEEVLSVCLLAYGNYLITVKKFQMIRDISDAIKNILRSFFKASSSEIISIRAAFCLIFVENLNIEYGTILNWFKNKLNITSEKEYKILLQQTLYSVNMSFNKYANKTIMMDKNEKDNEIINRLDRHFAEHIEMFIINLYEYLCNKDNSNYLSDPIPNYVRLALKISAKKLDEFRNAVKKSRFGENEFKKKLYLHWKNNPSSGVEAIGLYIVFGTLTVELVDMLVWIGDDNIGQMFLFIQHIERVSDRDAIEKLFELLDLKTYGYKFKNCLHVVETLAKNHDVSFLEIYQNVSLAISNVLHDDSEEWWNSQKVSFNWLLKFSCFNEEFLRNAEKMFFTESDIDEAFEREIRKFDQNELFISIK